MDAKEPFKTWAILELLGHQRFAGLVQEEIVFGAPLIRIDVPESGGIAGYTKYFGPNSLYGLTPVSEDVARAIAATWRSDPVAIYIPAFFKNAQLEPGDDEEMD